jgi:hypothetical protein
MTDDRGFISTIRDMLLLTEDDIAVNSVSGGRVAGLGVANPDISSPPQGEPGAAHRRRKRDAFKSPRDRRLYRKVLQGGTVEMSESGRWRFGLGLFEKIEGSVELHPVLPDRPEDLEPRDKRLKGVKKRKLKLKDGGVVEIHPSLSTRHYGEEVVDESRRNAQRPTAKCDYLCKIGLAADDLEHITWYRTVLKDPDVCINNATMRPVISNILNRILDLVFGDAVFYNRLRLLLLQNREREQSESVDPVTRFENWKSRVDEGSSFPSYSTAALQHKMAAKADPGRKAAMQAEIRGRTANRTRLRVGG